MNILALETSGGVCSVAVSKEKDILAELSVNNGRTHSELLMPLVDEALSHGGLTMGEIDLIAVARGPGSFTGLRIGMSTAKALAQAGDIPVAPISTLLGLANAVGRKDVLICPMMDARNRRVFTGLYRNGEAVVEDTVFSIDALNGMLHNYTGLTVVFTGDGVDAYRQDLNLFGRIEVQVGSKVNRYQRAGALIAPALEQHENKQTVSAYDAALDYLVASQAEQNLKLTHWHESHEEK